MMRRTGNGSGAHFADDDEPQVGRIMTRAGFLICSQPPPEGLPESLLDPRGVVPVCTLKYGDTLREFGNAVPLHSAPFDLENSRTQLLFDYLHAPKEDMWRPVLHQADVFHHAPQTLCAMLCRIPPSL